MTFRNFAVVDQVDERNFTEDKEGGDEKTWMGCRGRV